MARYDHLPVFKCVYSLTLYYYRLCKGLPKDIKYTIAAEVKDALGKIVVMIVRANDSREKVVYIKEALLLVELIKFKVRIMRDLDAIKLRSYEYLSRQHIEISKQLQLWKEWAEKGSGKSRST